MRRYAYKKYLALGIALFALLSLPSLFVEGVRGKVANVLSYLSPRKVPSKDMHTDFCRLEGENHLLRIEIGKLRALLEQYAKIESLKQQMQHFPLSARRYEEINYLTGLQCQAIPARVIYRDPGSWSSSIWVNVGEETNKQLNKAVIQKNSPVILGRSIVGAVDYVGSRQSRIRLITDMALKPSVRAVRGTWQNLVLIEQLDPLIKSIAGRNDLPLSAVEKSNLGKTLENLKEKISKDFGEWYLAKGILQGAGAPLWRRSGPTLRGIGFNYDFADEEGPARELVCGAKAVPIIQEGDLLVTTGMDGVFPAGFLVANVAKIYPLREGAYSYEIEAYPVIRNLDTLQTVFIIPAIGYNSAQMKEENL